MVETVVLVELLFCSHYNKVNLMSVSLDTVGGTIHVAQVSVVTSRSKYRCKVFNSPPPVVVRPGGVNYNSFIIAINPPGAYHNDCALWLAPLSL